MIIRDGARWMTLDCVVVSESAKALVECLRFQPTGGKQSSTIKAQEATGAILADLVISECEGVWSMRSLRSNSFTGQRVKYHSFDRALTAMEAAGALERLTGHSDRQGFGHVGRASCFRLTEHGKEILRQEGLDPETSVAAHFQRRPIGEK